MLMAQRILLIDDDVTLGGMVADYLAPAGFRVTSTATARDGEQRLRRETYDLLILDLMLPDGDGLEVCRRIRQTSDVPILMLTARGDAMDRVVGLEIGADDYVAKPVDLRELLARVKAVLRRTAGRKRNGEKVEMGRDFSLDFGTCRLFNSVNPFYYQKLCYDFLNIQDFHE